MAGKDSEPRRGALRRKRFSGMRERLSRYFLLAVLVPLGFGTLVSERLIERHIAGLARTSASQRLDSVMGRLEDRGRFVEMGLVQLATDSGVVEALASGDAVLAATALRGARMPRQLDVLALVSSDGHLVWRTGGPRDHATLAMKDDAALRRAFAGDSILSYEELDAGLVQAVTVPVRAGEKVIGALLGATVLTGNDALCARLVDKGQGEAALAHRGVWGASSRDDDADRPSAGAALNGTALTADQLEMLQRHQRWAGPATRSRETFMAMAPLVTADAQIVGAVSGLVTTAGLAALQADARRSFFAAMGLGTLVSLLLALLAARRVTGPLRRLAQAATAMQKGKPDVPIEVEGDDEVAQLALALKETAGAVSESMATLESRVEERVRELQQGRDREAALNRDLIAHNEQLLSQRETLRAQGEELERQRAELVEKTRRSEEADRLKSAFIANMSHEIRTPLNSVLALSQLLRDGMAGSLSGDQRKYLEVIERNGQNLLRLINDILDLSRIEAGHLEVELQPVDLTDHIRATVGTLVPLAEAKGLDLGTRGIDDLPAVRCDVDRVRQILTNLIGNAIKFTEAGHIWVSAEARGAFVAVHVTDTGVGIPDAAKAKVFEEFFQVDQSMARRQRGTGLGLAIASRLAHLMGGDIAVESVVGAGSRFTLTLPRSLEVAASEAEVRADHVGRGRGEAARSDALAAARRAGHAAVQPRDVEAPSPRGTSILIVEDNEDNLFTLRQILATLSLEMAAVASGREAIEYCRRRVPDLILMDMQMPGMSGLQATGAIRSLPGGPAIPIIALTAQAMKGDRERILAAGCDDYLSKPIQPKVLLAAIKRLLSRSGENMDGRRGAGATEEEEHGANPAGR